MKLDRMKPEPKGEESRIVEDVDKAREMAEAEDLGRTLSLAYRKYYDVQEGRANSGQTGSAGDIADAEMFKELYVAGITPEQIEREAVRAANAAERLYDDQEEIKQMGSFGLKMVQWALQWKMSRIAREVEAEPSVVADKMGLLRRRLGDDAAWKLRQLNLTGDANVTEHEGVMKRYDGLAQTLAFVESLQRARASSLEN